MKKKHLQVNDSGYHFQSYVEEWRWHREHCELGISKLFCAASSSKLNNKNHN
jgi:hypothetical protein